MEPYLGLTNKKNCNAFKFPVTFAVQHAVQLSLSKHERCRSNNDVTFSFHYSWNAPPQTFSAFFDLTRVAARWEHPSRQRTRLQSCETAAALKPAGQGESQSGALAWEETRAPAQLRRRIRLIIGLSETPLLPSLCCQSSIHFLT